MNARRTIDSNTHLDEMRSPATIRVSRRSGPWAVICGNRLSVKRQIREESLVWNAAPV